MKDKLSFFSCFSSISSFPGAVVVRGATLSSPLELVFVSISTSSISVSLLWDLLRYVNSLLSISFLGTVPNPIQNLELRFFGGDVCNAESVTLCWLKKRASMCNLGVFAEIDFYSLRSINRYLGWLLPRKFWDRWKCCIFGNLGYVKCSS